VVLADDEPLLRRGLRVLLETGRRVEVVAEASNGAELIEAVRRHRPDVVLVDVQMPGMDGLEALRTLREWPDPPVVAVLTTFDLDDYVATALDLGAQGFLLKDAEPDALDRAVLDLAAGGGTGPPNHCPPVATPARRGSGMRDNHQVEGLTGRER
jgi:DNA-binding NarL/FixJ family response regulator